MIRFRNLGRDVNANPVQLRVWITDGYPDLTGEMYTGPKSGDNPLEDIYNYQISDDNLIVDFNYIKATEWKKTYEVLPERSEHSSLAIIDGYVYLFGGRGTNKIFKAPTSDPARLIDTGSVLPETELYGSHCAVLDDGYVYLFGGNNGQSVSNIYSAPTSDPLSWTDHGELLPDARSLASLAINDGYIYLFGGRGINVAEDTIFISTLADPLIWSSSSNTLPVPLYSSEVIVANNYFYLLGGRVSDENPTERIYRSNVDTLIFNDDGYLPYMTCNGQVAFVGNDIYYYTPSANISDGYGYSYTTQTRILHSLRSDPLTWTDTGTTLPAEVSMSQIATIYDRLFLYGGSGSSAIFASNPKYIFDFSAPEITTYGTVTRTNYQAATGVDNKFEVLGTAPWKTNYS